MKRVEFTRDRIAAICESFAPAVWGWVPSTNEFTATPRVRALLGLDSFKRLSVHDLQECALPPDREWCSIFTNPAAYAGSSWPRLARFRILKPDSQSPRWIEARVWYEAKYGEEFFYGLLEDITDQTETLEALVDSTERLRLAIEAGKMAVWEVYLDTGEVLPSPELNLLLGFELDAQPNLDAVRGLYAPGEIERLAEEGATVELVRERAVGGAFEPWRKDAFKGGQNRTQVQAEVSIITPQGTPKHLMLRAQYVPTSEGRPRLTGLLIDISEKKRAEERLALVARELQHRVKNSLSVVQAIARQSLAGKQVSSPALESFLGRLQALAGATDLILSRQDDGADLRDVVAKILLPYLEQESSPFSVSGEAVLLKSAAATALGMALHELCTNAVKYGALSVQGGCVEIAWRRQGPNRLAMTWCERKGPPVSEPSRRGFGSRLIENVLTGELGGRVSLDYRREGLYCLIQLPLS